MITCKRGDVRRRPQHKTHVRVLKVETYQLSRLVKVMVVDVHPVFDEALEGLPIQMAEERDRVLLSISKHGYLKESGVEIVHVCDRRLPFIKRAPLIYDFPAAFGPGDAASSEGWSHSCGRTY